MKMVSWMHTADLHLGKPIEYWRGTQEEYIERKEEYRETFRRMIDLIQEKSISFLFIAGDFLEHGYVSRSLWDFIQEQFARIPDTQVWISPGNHDPYRTDSVYMKEKWPDHVHIFQDQWETHTYSEYDLQIVGKGFSDFHEKESSFPQIQYAGKKIMVVHGDFSMKQQKSDYFPICTDDLMGLELDYVALGHIHQSDSHLLSNERETIIRYPGSPEGLSWKETGERTVTLGKIDDQRKNIQTHSIHTKTYEQHMIELTGKVTKEQVLTKILENLSSYDQDSYHLLHMIGRISPDWSLAEDQPWLIFKLHQHGFQHVYLDNQLLPDFDLESLKRKSHVIARFIHMMEDKIATSDGSEQKKFQSALYKGLEAICTRELSS